MGTYPNYLGNIRYPIPSMSLVREWKMHNSGDTTRKVLLAKGRIARELIAMLSQWRHFGFKVFRGQRIFHRHEIAMETRARYFIQAFLLPGTDAVSGESSKVVYQL
jgi:hypothetical protein